MQSEFHNHNKANYIRNSNTASWIWSVWYNEYAGFEALILLYLELWFKTMARLYCYIIVYRSFEKYYLIINFSYNYKPQGSW